MEQRAASQYRRAVYAGALLAPGALCMAALSLHLPLFQGPPQAWLLWLGQAAAPWLILGGAVCMAGVTFLPVGLFLATRSQARVGGALALHVAWVALCLLLVWPLVEGTNSYARRRAAADVLQPQAQRLVQRIDHYERVHGHPPRLLEEVAACHRPVPGLAGATDFSYVRYGEAPGQWTLKVQAPGTSLRPDTWIYLPSQRRWSWMSGASTLSRVRS